ncbi:MAG: arsenate reductase ArsC [Candidatus Omnitrophica bacterium]|nr:arsenate reductase ArsC [Candidatus Omnitrophota bacterium]
MSKIRVLFVCIHNSARSQMAEGFLRHLAGDRFEVASAGIEPGALNPVVVQVMKERGIDISRHWAKGVEALVAAEGGFDYVITVCDESQAARCPVVPGPARRLHWGFDDPSSFEGSPEDRLVFTRRVRDRIEESLKEWLATF